MNLTAYEWASVGVAAITTAVNIIAVLFVGVQVRHAVEQAKNSARAREEQWTRERKRATVEFITSTMDLDRQLKSALPFFDRRPESAARLIEKADGGDEITRNSIRAYLDYLESIATGINEGVLDLGTVDRMRGGRIIAIATNLAPYIERRRLDLAAPTLYCELEQLAESLQRRRLGQATSPQ